MSFLWTLSWVQHSFSRSLSIYVKYMFILSSWLQKSNLLDTSKMISSPFLWLCFSIECDHLLWNICVCFLVYFCWTALCWAELSLTILYFISMEKSFHNHMPKIFSCLKTRTKRLCHLRRDYTVICTKSSVLFSYFAFRNIPGVHCMLNFSVESRRIERECGNLLEPVEKIIVQIKLLIEYISMGLCRQCFTVWK